MQFSTDVERRTREYKEAANRFRGVQSELLERLHTAEEAGRVEDATQCLKELEVAALGLLKLREGYSAKLDFINQYQIKLSEGKTVSLVLPEAVSHTEFLRHAQNVAHEVYGVFPISPSRLAQWERFPTPVEYGGSLPDLSTSRRIAVQLALSESAEKTLQEQIDFLRERNLSLASVIDTVAACAAYLVVTGESGLSDFETLRAAGGCVQCDGSGITLRGVWDQVASPKITVSVNA